MIDTCWALCRHVVRSSVWGPLPHRRRWRLGWLLRARHFVFVRISSSCAAAVYSTMIRKTSCSSVFDFLVPHPLLSPKEMTPVTVGTEGAISSEHRLSPHLSEDDATVCFPGSPSGRLLWPRHASDDLPVQELHPLCDQREHLHIVPDWPDVWTHHQARDTRAQGQVEVPGAPEELPVWRPVCTALLYSAPPHLALLCGGSNTHVRAAAGAHRLVRRRLLPRPWCPPPWPLVQQPAALGIASVGRLGFPCPETSLSSRWTYQYFRNQLTWPATQLNFFFF